MGERARAHAGVGGSPAIWVPDYVARPSSATRAGTLGVLHDVEALEESAFLLTIAWPGGDDVRVCHDRPLRQIGIGLSGRA